MKIGDSIICINDVFDSNRRINAFIKDKKYKIKFIEDDILKNDGTLSYSIYITNERNTTSGFHGKDMFDKHFITMSELRKLKLQKLKWQ